MKKKDIKKNMNQERRRKGLEQPERGQIVEGGEGVNERVGILCLRLDGRLLRRPMT